MRVAYIAGCTHSGSTLLNRVLGACPGVVTLGSVKKLDDVMRKRATCCCGAPDLLECPFWSRVDSELRDDGKSLDALCVRTRRNQRFEADNLALFSAVERATGATVIVDSSRRSSRYRRLARMPQLEVIPIHLFKTPCAQAGAWKKRGKNLIQSVGKYWTRNLRIIRALRIDPAAVTVSYEQFCRNPESALRGLCAHLGITHDPETLDTWGKQPLHSLGGNHMKFNTSSKINLDDSWRSTLSPVWVKVMNASCGVLWRRKEVRRRETFMNGRPNHDLVEDGGVSVNTVHDSPESGACGEIE